MNETADTQGVDRRMRTTVRLYLYKDKVVPRSQDGMTRKADMHLKIRRV